VEVQESLTMPTSNENQQNEYVKDAAWMVRLDMLTNGVVVHSLETVSAALAWLDVLSTLLPLTPPATLDQTVTSTLAATTPLATVQTALEDMLARMHDTSMAQVAFADPRFYSRA
jgi:hypothetical protein